MPSYSVSVRGLEKLHAIPGGLDQAQKELLEGAVKRIARSVGDAAPKRSGRLAASWKGEVRSSTEARVHSNSDYAKSQDRGAFISPKKKALRFNNGHFQRVPVRLPATGYVKQGLRSRGKIIREEYQKAFDNLNI